MSLLVSWENFYGIIGASAATLTGLMFVAITLIAGVRGRRADGVIAAFSTPTVVHFSTALLIAAILSAPWQVLWNVSLLLGISGLGGIIYIIVVIQRTRHQTAYTPVLEDWLWHVLFPLVSYVALAVAAIVLPSYPVPSLFVIAAVTVLLLFIGIHNAWDAVTFVVIKNSQPDNKLEDKTMQE